VSAPPLLTDAQREALQQACSGSPLSAEHWATLSAMADDGLAAMHDDESWAMIQGTARWLLAADARLRGGE
jgi:hypothetical protein